MLFHVSWESSGTSEEDERRLNAVFEKWQPPEEVEFQGFFASVDGTRGFAIVAADSAQALARTTAPWTPWLEFEVTPIIPVEESAQIANEAIAFRDSVG
jgi:hypothetical protein